MPISFRNPKLWLMMGTAATILVFAAMAIDLMKEKIRDNETDRKIAMLDSLTEIGEGDSFHRQVDKITNFVWSNSLHRIDDDFRKIQNRTDLQAGLLRAHAMGETPEKPHLECSTRSSLVEHMLWNRGYKTRSVATWRSDKRMSSHTFLEVWNGTNHHWEITDPDHNFYWFDTLENRRAGIEDLMRFPITRFRLCTIAEGCPAPSLMRDRALLGRMAALFGVAVVWDREADTRVLYHNADRFDLTPFCGRFGKYCRDRRVMVASGP
jgi:hypothetical protein